MKTKTLWITVLFGITFSIIQCSGSSTLPSEISGKWTTVDEAYKGEYIEISPTVIVFGSDSKGSFAYTIRKVQSEKGPEYNTTIYKVTCTDSAGDENLFSFIFNPDTGGTLRYKSSKSLWTRSNGTGSR